MPFAVEYDELRGPIDVGFFRPLAVMQQGDLATQLIEQLRRL